MIPGAAAGTAGFILLVYFEVCKCRSVKEGKEQKNPWFTLGTLLLISGWVIAFALSPKAGGFRLAAGIVLTVAAAALYIRLLRQTPQKQDGSGPKLPLIDTGAYAKVRHPGIWCFLLVAAAITVAAPHAWPVNLLFVCFNVVYCILQDRLFFPVYIEGYEEYKKRVPFCLPCRLS